MQAFKTLEEYQNFVDCCEKGGLTKNPGIAAACQLFTHKGDTFALDDLIRLFPDIVAKAIQLSNQAEKAMKDNPYNPEPWGMEAKPLRGQRPVAYFNSQKETLSIDPDLLTRGMLVTGAPGTGKTVLIDNIVSHIIKVPRKDRDYNVIAFETMKNDMVRHSNLYSWLPPLDLSDLRYNPWQVDDWDSLEEKMRWAFKVFCGENFIYTQGHPALQYALMKVYRDNGCFDGSKRWPTWYEIRVALDSYMRECGLDGGDVLNTVNKLKSRMLDFEMMGPWCNVRQGLPLDFFIKGDLIINVGKHDKFSARTFIMTMLNDMQRHYKTLPGKNRLRTLLVFDEAAWIFSDDRSKMDFPADEILIDFNTTCREHGFGRIIGVQFVSRLAYFITSTCATRVGFPMYHHEHEEMQRLLNLTDEQAAFVPNLVPYGVGVMRHRTSPGRSSSRRCRPTPQCRKCPLRPSIRNGNRSGDPWP